MNWVMGIDPAVPGSETTAAWRVEVSSGIPSLAQVVTVAYPAPFDLSQWMFLMPHIPEGCLRVCGEVELL